MIALKVRFEPAFYAQLSQYAKEKGMSMSKICAMGAACIMNGTINPTDAILSELQAIKGMIANIKITAPAPNHPILVTDTYSDIDFENKILAFMAHTFTQSASLLQLTDEFALNAPDLKIILHGMEAKGMIEHKGNKWFLVGDENVWRSQLMI